MPSDPLPRPHPSVVSRALQGDLVLVNLDTNKIFALNSTGARLWTLLEAGLDRLALERQLREEFDVEPGELRREIDAMLSSLVAKNLVVPGGS